jgi:SAM-dependent methyltransferase
VTAKVIIACFLLNILRFLSAEKFLMNRNVLNNWYQSPRGKLLQHAEADFLQQSITVGCKQVIVQVGGLGWENEFIDCSLYQRFVVVDCEGIGWHEAAKIDAVADQLPIASESVGMIILPHILEFNANQHQILREIDRILKPEGKLIILNFNPWSPWMRYQYFRGHDRHDPLHGYFLSRSKIMDWLKLLNFKVEVAAGFRIDPLRSGVMKYEKNKNSIRIDAYAIKAIKRRYNIIPFAPVKARVPRFAMLGAIESSTQLKKS